MQICAICPEVTERLRREYRFEGTPGKKKMFRAIARGVKVGYDVILGCQKYWRQYRTIFV
jgi:hypothetical protein